MIYEYPEEFVVPIKYVDDLKEKPAHRAWKIKYLKVDDFASPSQEMQNKILEGNNKYLFEFGKDSWEEPYEEGMLEDDFWHKNDKSILSEADTEYVHSELLR
jgi:hypothetical protein